MASIRKRVWTSRGIERSAWVVDYFDQRGKRRLKTFATKGSGHLGRNRAPRGEARHSYACEHQYHGVGCLREVDRALRS
jgi:hypothetical protein